MRLRSLLWILSTLLSISFIIANDEAEIVVEDYLESLSVEDLRQICVDRGFEIRERADGKELTKDDYREAARRCLSLEDEMNAILAENPELAAEIEAEVERMRQMKEELELEREAMLREKAFLEKQLQDAGIDIKKELKQEEDECVGDEKNVTNVPAAREVDLDTLQGVLKESFILLYERVRDDFRFLWKLFGPVLRPILKPVAGGLKLLWRHLRPQREAILREMTAR